MLHPIFPATVASATVALVLDHGTTLVVLTETLPLAIVNR